MNVFRIEDREGRGMYRSYNSVTFTRIAFADPNHPSPWEDSLFRANIKPADGRTRPEVEHHRFGFVSVEQLRTWIYRNDWLVQLHEAGFNLAVYDVDPDDVIVGNTQCAYLFRSENFVEHHDIVKFFSL